MPVGRRLLLLLCALALAPAGRAVEGDVTIYRCTDAKGHLTLRDTPCGKGQQQETRTMVRPRDGVPFAPDAPVVERTPAPEPYPVVLAPPRPLYECVTPDGDLYVSDTNEGHPRWVPLWTLGYPYVSGISSAGMAVGGGSMVVEGGRPALSQYSAAYAYGAGTWIRDECHELPPQETCARLTDRRDEIRRRFFNAMPSERDVLRVEERSINARLDNDCGSY